MSSETRTAADVVLTGMLEIKNIDKQLKNQSVVKSLYRQNDSEASGKTGKAEATRARAEADESFERKTHTKWIGRALQLRKWVKKVSADEVRKDPEGLGSTAGAVQQRRNKDRQTARLVPEEN